MTAPAGGDTPYGLSCPTLTDARDAMYRVHGDDGPVVWNRLLDSTGIAGTETGAEVPHHLLDAMTALDPVSRLCAHALRIRLASHAHLSAAHTMTRSTA